MTDNQRHIPFQVDIAGIIDIMGASLYSRHDTPIRELLQNAHDAIMRRRRQDLGFQGEIHVLQDAENGTLSVSDNGVGLTVEEAENYLGTLGLGITGLIKKGEELTHLAQSGDQGDLIGQFGVGLFSAFMLADRLIVESKNESAKEAVRWEAGAGTDIQISTTDRQEPGTTVTLQLKPDYRFLAEKSDPIESAIKEYADFLPIPIFLNDSKSRVNVIQAAWFEPSPDQEAMELALQAYFDETPLDVLPIRIEQPVSIAGALYVSPQRLPGFGETATVMVTVRRMVISRKIQGLFPAWATFLRGCLELHDCAPTASREDLVRNKKFELVAAVLEDFIFQHFENLLNNDPQKMEAIVNWHRYTLAGAALDHRQLRDVLRQSYRLPTSQGALTIQEIIELSEADPLFEEEAERVVWYNTDRRQEQWVNSLFSNHDVPCVHTFRSFEESLIARCLADDYETGLVSDLRIASPSAPNFANAILGVRDLSPVDEVWIEFFSEIEAKISVGTYRADQPVMAFLNERYELAKSFDDLKQRGDIPAGFQRLIETHFEDAPTGENEIILNRSHPLVARVLEQKPGTPLSSVLRLIVVNALNSAGASTPKAAQNQQQADLEWIAECLWGKE